MPEKIEIGEQALRTRYNDEGQSLSEIADEFDCSIATVHNRMEEYGIPRESTQDVERYTVECAYCEQAKNVARWEYKKRKRFFCDNDCQGKLLEETGETRGPNNGRWKGKEIVACAYCGEQMEVYPARLSEKENHLCDNECRGKWQSKYLSGENHPLWEEKAPDSYTGSWRRMRDRIRSRDGNTCQLCGKQRRELSRSPDAHHIQPIKTFDDPENAHTPMNLVQLCTKCHRFMELKPTTHQHTLLQLIMGGPYQSGEYVKKFVR